MSSTIPAPLAAVISVLALARGWTAQRPPILAAAANLNFALTEIKDRFVRERGTPVEVVFGASGTLTRQILDGAPFELFLAADEGLNYEAVLRIVDLAKSGLPDVRLEFVTTD